MKKKFFVVLLIAGILAGFATRFVLQSRAVTKRFQISARTHWLAFIFEKYYAHHGTLPKPCLQNDLGTPMHSWRTVLYADVVDREHGHYSDMKTYRWESPWDDPQNTKVLDDSSIHVAFCRPFKKDYKTCFAAVLTKDGRWYADVWGKDCVTPVLLVVYDPHVLVPLAEPRDITVAELIKDLQKPASPAQTFWGIFFNPSTGEFLCRKLTSEDIQVLQNYEMK